MDLKEVLAEIPWQELLEARQLMNSYVAREYPYEFKSVYPSKTELIEYFDYQTNLWDETRATKILGRINQTDILIENPNEARIAILLGLLQNYILEQMAHLFNVDISNDLSHGHCKLANLGPEAYVTFLHIYDAYHWYAVSKLAEFAAKSPQEQPKEGIVFFCPHCEDASPRWSNRCITCRRELPQRICPSCGTANSFHSKFCMSCNQER